MSKREELLTKYYEEVEISKLCLAKATAFRELHDTEDLNVDRTYLRSKINSEVTRGKSHYDKAIQYLHLAAESL